MSLILDGSNGTTGNLANGDLQVNGVTVGKGGSTVASNTIVGTSALNSNTTGNSSVAIGYQGLYTQSTGVNNTAVGYQALRTGNINNSTAVGYQAGYNTNADANTYVGAFAGITNSSGTNNVYVGQSAGYNATGAGNTFVGQNSGSSVTTGAKNAILGSYNGNQGSLDIRTLSNNIVLSDGDGNPKIVTDNNGNTAFNGIGSSLGGTTPYAGSVICGQSTAANWLQSAYYGGSNWKCGELNTKPSLIQMSTGNVYIYTSASQGAVGTTISWTLGPYVNNTGTSWTSPSDIRLKNVTGEIQNGLEKVCSLKAAEFTWKSDSENKPQVGLIAQEVEQVLPQAISRTKGINEDGEEYLGVQYNDVVPLLLAAIKELNAKVDAQAAEIEALKAKGV